MNWKLGLAILAVHATIGVGANGAEPDKLACIDANERAQVLHHDGRWLEARDQLLVCSNDACPTLVRSECARYLADVATKMPRLVAVVRDENGHDVGGARFAVDRSMLWQPVPGTPIELDPGEHTLRFTGDGRATVERAIVLREGETDRRLEVVLGPLATSPRPAGARPPAVPPAPRRPNVPAWIATGVGVAALGVFGGFAIAGKVEELHLADTCRGHCSDEQIVPVERAYLVADVALGVAVTAAVLATILFLVHRPSAPTTVAITF
jgi:hypothetical protein